MHRFTIDKNDIEYDRIHDMFKASLALSPSMPNTEVVKIERIQNPRLHQIYEGQKAQMSNGGNEMRLFHGTAKMAVDNINTTGFNRAYCGKNGKLAAPPPPLPHIFPSFHFGVNNSNRGAFPYIKDYEVSLYLSQVCSGFANPNTIHLYLGYTYT